MIHIDDEAPADAGARDVLLDRVMPDRATKPSERLRAGRTPAEGLALVARRGADLVGTVRLWPVTAGDCPALLLGPLAIDPAFRGKGVGAGLMMIAVNRATLAGHQAVILVGDPEYYARFGFAPEPTAGLILPAPVERRRLLGLELGGQGLVGAVGLVTPVGERVPVADMSMAA